MDEFQNAASRYPLVRGRLSIEKRAPLPHSGFSAARGVSLDHIKPGTPRAAEKPGDVGAGVFYRQSIPSGIGVTRGLNCGRGLMQSTASKIYRL